MSDADRGQVASTAAEVYEEFFVPALFAQWPETLLDAAGVAVGDKVLDIGCGTGVLARAAQARGAVVTGLDPNPGMLAVAGKTDGIQWERGVAEELDFEDDSFDVVVSQFAIMFFEDRPRAASEMRRVLRPGGRLAVASWASLDVTPGYQAMVAILAELFGEQAADALRSPYCLGNPEELAADLRGAFDHIEVTQHPGLARFDSIDAWVHTDIRGWTLSDMTDTDFEILLDTARTRLAVFAGEDQRVEFAAPALVATSG